MANEFMSAIVVSIGVLTILGTTLPDPREYKGPPKNVARVVYEPVWPKTDTHTPTAKSRVGDAGQQSYRTRETVDLQDGEGPKATDLDIEYNYDPSNAASNIPTVELQSATSEGEDHLDKLSHEQQTDLEHGIAEEERSYHYPGVVFSIIRGLSH